MMHTAETSQKNLAIGRIAFLFLAFPLGLIYFLVIVIGLSVGLGTLVIWIGLPILFITFFVVRCLAEVERRLVTTLLHIPIDYQVSSPPLVRQGFLRQFGHMLSDPYSWTSLVYMLLKFPLGIISFSLVLTLLSVSFALTLLPVAYLINLLVNVILAANGVVSTGYIIPGFIEIHTTFDLTMFLRSFIGVPIGLLTWFCTLFLINTMALVSGEMARALLGPGTINHSAQPQQMYTTIPTSQETTQQYVYTE